MVRRISSSRPITGSSLPSRAASRNFRQLVESVFGGPEDRAGIASGTVDQAGGEAFAVVQQHFQHVQRRKLLMAFAHCKRLRCLDKTARTLGIFFNIHRYSPQPAAPPGARSAKADTGFASDRAPNSRSA